MLPNVLFKTLRDQRRSLPFWGVGLVLLAAFLAGLYPTVRDNNVFQQMVEAYPDELKGLMGLTDSMDISSGVGWLNIEAFGFMVPLVFIVYGVLAGAAAIAGEEARGTLYLLLTEPIERGRVVVEKFGAMALAMGALCVVLYAALAVGAVATGMDDVGMLNLAAITGSAALLGLVFGALALAIGCATGRSGLAGGVSAAAAIAAYLVNAVRASVESLSPVKWVSPFYYYNGADPLANGLEPVHALVLAAAAVALCAIGYLGFRRRDIAV
jgi:ABC-2 type transport system permease protein